MGAAALVASGIAVVAAGPASAGADGCLGTQVYAQNVYGQGAYSGKIVAIVYGYWDGSANCEVAVKQVLVGQRTYMSLSLFSSVGKPDNDAGDFLYYAGPTNVDGIGSCVWEQVVVDDAHGGVIAQYNSPPHNCG